MIAALVTVALMVGSAISTPIVPLPDPVAVENWQGDSDLFHRTRDLNRIAVVPLSDATDGRALQLQLDAQPGPGPRNGVEIAGNTTAFRFGTFSTRMKTADCAGQKRPGVVTGFLVYSSDVSDTNRNGTPDNSEIDVEVLCAQPDVVWMSLWTDYDELADTPRKISRAVNLRTGKVIYNCYLRTWLGACAPLLAGENDPATVPAVPGFDSARQFTTYTFDWQANRVRFYATDARGQQVLLWDYQGPVARIPQKPAMLLQNVWHTPNWDPFDGPAHNRPVVSTSAYIDTTTAPLWAGPPATWPGWVVDPRDRPHRARRPRP